MVVWSVGVRSTGRSFFSHTRFTFLSPQTLPAVCVDSTPPSGPGPLLHQPEPKKKKTTRQKVVCQCYFVTSSTTFSFPPISPPPLRPLFFLHNGRAASVPPSPAPGYVCNWGVGAYFKIYIFFQPGSFFFLCPLSLSVPPLLFLPRSYIFFFPFYFTNQIFFLKKIKKKIMP